MSSGTDKIAPVQAGTLMALVDYCTEHLPSDERVTLDVPIRDLAERVLAVLRQVRLRESTDRCTSPAAQPASINRGMAGDGETNRIRD